MSCATRLIAGMLLLGPLSLVSCSNDPSNPMDSDTTGNTTDGSQDGDGTTEEMGDGVDREDGSGSADVVVVPRSVGGGVAEAEAFDVERETVGLETLSDRRDGAGLALRFLRGARERFRRVLNVARRIERARLDLLGDQGDTADVTVDTPSGETICLRISNAPFATARDGGLEGGAALDADLERGEKAISLRIWVNRSCSSQEGDYVRFYASIIEQRPEDVALDDDDDSSESAWRAGRGRAWIHPGALLDVDPEYRARAEWDHSDPAFRRTVFQEQGRIGPAIVVESARYVVLREETTAEDGTVLLCKRVHASVQFTEHPRISEADLKLGTCVSVTEEGNTAERLLLTGTFVPNDGSEPRVLEAGCLAPGMDDTQNDCTREVDPERLDLQDDELVDDSLSSTDVELCDEAFTDSPPEDTDLVDLDQPADDAGSL